MYPGEQEHEACPPKLRQVEKAPHGDGTHGSLTSSKTGWGAESSTRVSIYVIQVHTSTVYECGYKIFTWLGVTSSEWISC